MPFAREASDAGAASVVRRELGWAESPMPSAVDLVGARHWRAVYLGLSWRATLAMQSLVVRPLALVAPFLQELMGSGDQVLALVLFGEMEWQDMRALHDLDTSDEKGGPSWQYFHTVYSQMAVCGAYRIHGVQILPKSAHFGYIAAICCQGGAFFLSEVQFGIHQAKNLPRMSIWESFR